MRDTKSKLLLSLCVVLTCGWLAAWTAGWFLLPPRPERAHVEASLALGMLLLAATGILWAQRLHTLARQAAECFERLASSDRAQLSRLAADPESLPLEVTHPWFGLARRFTDRIAAELERADLADQSRAALEVRLRRSAARQEQLEAILAGLPDGVIAVNAFDELAILNPAAARLFAVDETAAIGQPLAATILCHELVDLLTETRRRKAPGQRSGEVELSDDHGRARWYAVACRSFAHDDRQAASPGKASGAFAALRDITDLKSGQRRYADFVSSVSHEMKSPLTGIKAYVELLADGEAEEPETREEFLRVIHLQADRLQRLIDNLLNLARIEAGVMNVAKVAVSLNELLAEALGVIRPAAEARQIAIAADFSPLYLGVLADRDMLIQVAINLLSNAVKYTPEGGRVTLRSRLADEQVQFEVEDTGVGLSLEDQVKVFEKFYRVKKDRDMANGTGLGLPLAKHIVEDVHGGRLTVRSTPGAGSVFAVTLPTKGSRETTRLLAPMTTSSALSPQPLAPSP